jgi:hypothetical protein
LATKIYLLSTNPNAPETKLGANSADLFFLMDGPLRVVPAFTYCVPTGVRLFTKPEDASSSDVFIIPRSSSSLLEKFAIKSQPVPKGVECFATRNVALSNTIALIDWNYRGDIQLRVSTHGMEPVVLDHNRPYFQIVPRDPSAELVVVTDINDIPGDYLTETERQERGLGSTS